MKFDRPTMKNDIIGKNRDDLGVGIWKQEGEKREEREDWVKVEWKGRGTRKEQGDWARSGFGGMKARWWQQGGEGGA